MPISPFTEQLSLPSETHRNHYLFSDYYLDHVAGGQPAWREAGVGPLLDELAGLWAGFEPQGENEPQTEDAWIRPVLRALGHAFNVQVSMQTPVGSRKPDYVFYPDAGLAQAAPRRDLAEADFRGAIAIGDAKAWDVRLDRPLTARQKAAGPKTSENPSFQIDFYIRHSGLPWGILTNGRLWRLYHRDSSKKLDVFYEVDLPALLDQAAAPGAGVRQHEAFKYFALFFRREAFLGEPAWLDAVLEESRSYAQGISDTLKDQVYEALGVLAQGFLDFPENGLAPGDDTLAAIYDHSLILLYRLLFTFYAEDRGLLPVRANAAYRQSYSLYALKRRIATDLDQHVPAVASLADLWHKLVGQWRVINVGNAELGVQAYDGGLFDPARHPFLEQHRVGDRHLRRAIDLLARAEDPRGGGRQFVDYRDLEVRHLGSIYEGLLEYRVRVAAEPLAVRREKGREVYLPAAEAELPVAVPAGRVYLTTDKGERKATGSYYTPEYIVQYIVEHTVGPVLEELHARYGGDLAALQRAVLAANVLDLGMGSGHFLVAATDFVARFLVSLGLETPADMGEEGELAYWRRRVAQACIYGVDVNPLAVELAKLSLWLATVAKDRPLSFLDHHLRTGNSLIGARMADLPLTGRPPKRDRRREKAEAAATAAGQLSMLEDSAFAGAMSTANFLMGQIEALRNDTLEDVHRAEAIYRDQVRQQTEKGRRLADVWTARHFGLEFDDALWPGLVAHVLHGAFALPQHEAILLEAERIARARRFFHWELEFPEVFFDRHGRLDPETAGFDAVVGNPPYVRQEGLKEIKPFLQTSFASAHNMADLYLYFYEQGLRLIAQDRRMAYISSGTFARANFAAPFRQYLPTVAQIESLIDFGENQPFEGAEMVRPTIMVLEKGRQTRPFRSLFIADKIPPSLDKALHTDGVDCDPNSLQAREWTFQAGSATRLFERILAAGRPLREVVGGQMYRGILTGLNEAFIIDGSTRERLVVEDPSSDQLIKPILRGEDLRPWYQEDEGRWLLVLPNGWTSVAFGSGLSEAVAWDRLSDRHPTVAEHLAPHAEAGRQRHDKGEFWWELRPCDYYDVFESPKLFWPDIAKLPRFSFDEQGQFINNQGYILPTMDLHLLGLLQSRALWFTISQVCQPLRLRAGLWQYRMFAQFITRLPIPDAPLAAREAIGSLAMRLTEEAKARYGLHRRARGRVVADLGGGGAKLNQKLTAFWGLDFPAFRAETQKVFRRDIPLKERDEWEEWLAAQRAEHERRTAEIVRLETELNARVYELFDLTPAEIRLIEESTKYHYGEV